MFLGATAGIASRLDPSFDLGRLLSAIGLDGVEISSARGSRGGVTGVKVDVREVGGRIHGRKLSDIREVLARGGLSEAVRERAGAAFVMLAEAEGKIHGIPPGEVHFHEVGAADSIVDITGAMLMMEHLGWPAVMSSPVNVGSGTVRCAHGLLPVPAPATAELLEGMRIFSSGEPMERTTPTGALLLRALAGPDCHGDLPEGRVICADYGLGERDTPDVPNVLRATLIERGSGSARFVRERPSLLSANIDDMNPQDFALAMERLLESGALDAWCENILMKKGRPAIKLCCLARSADEERLAELMMRETTTIGVRVVATDRYSLARSAEKKSTPIGDVTYKSVTLDGEILRSVPEYEDILKIAREKNIPIHEAREIIARSCAADVGGDAGSDEC
jgi:uncharacterized protein (TIGR00299 family) protein